MPTLLTLRRDVDRLLARLRIDDADCPPRTLAVVIAIRDGVPAEVALARCGVDLSTIPPPSLSFRSLAEGQRFRHQGVPWMKASLDGAYRVVAEVDVRRRVVAAYAEAAARRQIANAFRMDGPDRFVAARFGADDEVHADGPDTA
ncbi:MAG: hypothetical protein AAFQ53_00455 [Bacteroidota bacterium]